MAYDWKKYESIKEKIESPSFRRNRRALIITSATIILFNLIGANFYSFSPLGVSLNNSERKELIILFVAVIFLYFLYRYFLSFKDLRDDIKYFIKDCDMSGFHNMASEKAGKDLPKAKSYKIKNKESSEDNKIAKIELTKIKNPYNLKKFEIFKVKRSRFLMFFNSLDGLGFDLYLPFALAFIAALSVGFNYIY